MGLDITAYSKLVKRDPQPPREADECETNGVRFYPNNKDFSGRADEIECHLVYDYETCSGFRAGSYSGYNKWRDQLCKAVHGITAERFWTTPGAETMDLHDLINFSDCEGVIGASVCAKIAAQMRSNKAKIVAWSEANMNDMDRPYFLQKLGEWLVHLDIAADGGALRFH